MDVAGCEREIKKQKLEESSKRPEQEEKENEGGEDVKDENFLGSDYESNDDEIYDEKMSEYSKQVAASDGFDFDDFSKLNACGMIIPLPKFAADAKTSKKLHILSALAISKYNEENRANYRFVRVVKANVQGVAGYLHYITFEAKEAEVDPNTFQALTYSGFLDAKRNREYEVEFCRLKITNKEKVNGDVTKT